MSTITPFSHTNRPALGAQVQFTRKMHRVYQPKTDSFDWQSIPVKQSQVGTYVGYRVKQAGYVKFHGYNEGSEWKRTGSIFVALVVCDERKAPVPVPFEALTLVE